MHYVICYDLESDRLREKTVKLLQRNGCSRVQKSVFVAADMTAKQVAALKTGLDQLWKAGQRSPQDSLLIMPLPNECALQTASVGPNNMLTALAELPLKIIL